MPSAIAIRTWTYSCLSGERRAANAAGRVAKSAASELRIKPLFPAQLSRILTMTLIASSMRSRANLIAMGTSASGKVWVWIIFASKRFWAISAVGRALALAANAKHVDVVAHEVGEIDRHRIGGEGRKTDPPAAIDHPCSLVERVRRAGTFEHVLDTLAAGDPLDSFDRVFLVDIDDRVGAEPFADREPALARAGQDHRLRTQRLGDAYPHQTDRSRSGNDDPFAGDNAAHYVEPVHCRAGGDDEGRLLVGHVVGNADHRVDVVQGVFGEAAIGAEAIGAMAFAAVAVIEARGIHAFAAALALPAPGMDLDGDAVADLEFVDSGAEPHDRAHIFVPRRKAPIERELAIHQRRDAMFEDLDVGRAYRDRIDPDQHFGGARLRHRFLHRDQLFRVTQHPGLHCFGDPVFVGAVLRHAKAPARVLFSRIGGTGRLRRAEPNIRQVLDR